MNQPSVDQIVDRVCRLERDAVIRELLAFPGPTRLDYTNDFLADQSTERLRHLLLAAHLQARTRANQG